MHRLPYSVLKARRSLRSAPEAPPGPTGTRGDPLAARNQRSWLFAPMGNASALGLAFLPLFIAPIVI